MKKKLISVLLTLSLVTAMTVGCGSSSSDSETTTEETTTEETTTEETTTEADSDEVVELSFYGLVVEYTSGPLMCDAADEVLGDGYDVDWIQVDWTNLETVIRTGIASGDPCDVYNFEGNRMSSFADEAVDLTPYLDANDGEWRSQFSESALEMCTVDGKILAIPWEVNAPVLLANKDLLDAAGVEVPESWTYDEFLEACEKIQSATEAYAFGTPMDLAQGSWLWRTTMLSASVETGTYEDYYSGNLDFTGDETAMALEAILSIYENDYAYPGEAAVTISRDETQAAYAQGDVAMIGNVASGAYAVAEGCDFETVVLPWPSLGDETVIGAVSANAFFVPSSSDNIEAAVEAIKAFTSTEVASVHSEEGYIPANTNVEIANSMLQSIADIIDCPYIYEFSTTEMVDYYNNSLMPDLILYGGVETTQANIEQIRQNSLAN